MAVRMKKRLFARSGSHQISRHRGFSLIELLVGLAIGLLIAYGVVRIYVASDGRNRNIGAKNDAQMAASLGAYALEQDIRLAGRGFSGAEGDMLGCNLSVHVQDATPSTVAFTLAPLVITDGADGAPDEIRVFYGNSPVRVLHDYIVHSDGDTKRVRNRAGFLLGDKVLMASATACAMAEITEHDTADEEAFRHGTNGYVSSYATGTTTPTMNTADGTSAVDAALGGGYIFSMGPAPQHNVWSITRRSGNSSVSALSRTNSLPRNSDDVGSRQVVEGIVNLQAQYGYDQDGDGMISESEWIEPASMPATIVWEQVLAVRYGILARSAHYEAPPYTAAQPVWSGGNFAMTDLSGDEDTSPGDARNWRRYRYEVQEGIVSLRNYLPQWR